MQASIQRGKLRGSSNKWMVGRVLSGCLAMIFFVLCINRISSVGQSKSDADSFEVGVHQSHNNNCMMKECEPCPVVSISAAVPPAANIVEIPPSTISKQQEEVAIGQKYNFVKQNAQHVKDFLNARQTWSPEKWEEEAIRLVEKNQIHRYTIIAAANIGHLNFTLNWIASLKLNKFDKFLIYSFDFQLYSILVEFGFHENAVIAPLTWIKYEIPPKEHKWMEDSYNKLTQGKLRIQSALLERNYWILFSDVDVVFCSPHVLDHVRYLIGDYCSETNEGQCFTDFAYMYDQDTDINTGFFVARSTPTIKEVFRNTIEHMKRWGVDQLAFNYEIRTLMKIKYSKTFKGLDKLLYANGGIFHHEKLNEKFNMKPMVVHANYAEGYEAKKKMLQKHGYWHLLD